MCTNYIPLSPTVKLIEGILADDAYMYMYPSSSEDADPATKSPSFQQPGLNLDLLVMEKGEKYAYTVPSFPVLSAMLHEVFYLLCYVK